MPRTFHWKKFFVRLEISERETAHLLFFFPLRVDRVRNRDRVRKREIEIDYRGGEYEYLVFPN